MPEVIEGQEVKRSYTVDDDIVTLTITIGEAQIGSSAVFLDEGLIAKGDVGTVTIGHGALLRGRTLSIRSIVSDINASTDRTSVTYELAGGTSPLSVTLTALSGGNNTVVVYFGFFPFE
jgi:hypothetical protein